MPYSRYSLGVSIMCILRVFFGVFFYIPRFPPLPCKSIISEKNMVLQCITSIFV
ncbi:hypothetical protein T440DRAFT_140597 [Plenodomus tracheiphilus IPT5]|uniref:Uncharacterized protein n=1 Tax=Plenodomus tracheiphilus IPT5 TaxID=1408161 RepID=A0A6A7B166_9PLEO|nr:hypothetical protein T440DRAFT_140597 [Plenodomus tracheiphilus IPT5]